MLITRKNPSKECNNLHCDGINSETCVKKACVFFSMATCLVVIAMCYHPWREMMLKAHHYYSAHALINTEISFCLYMRRLENFEKIHQVIRAYIHFAASVYLI